MIRRVHAQTVLPALVLGFVTCQPAFSAPAAGRLSPDTALQALKAGNVRFTSANSTHPHDNSARIAETAQGQTPIATIVACSDSRVPPEVLLDQGIGDIFVVRVAGNVTGTDETASVEYAVEHLHTPLLIVMGHQKCGAVAAAVAGTPLDGSLPALIERIRPAVKRARAADPRADNDTLLAAAIQQNVWESIEHLLRTSAVVREHVRNGSLKIVGAVYDLTTGQVKWLGQDSHEARLIGRRS